MGVRSALSERNELTIVGEAGDLDSGLPLVARSRPHVVVVGIREHERSLLDNLPRGIQSNDPRESGAVEPLLSLVDFLFERSHKGTPGFRQ